MEQETNEKAGNTQNDDDRHFRESNNEKVPRQWHICIAEIAHYTQPIHTD